MKGGYVYFTSHRFYEIFQKLRNNYNLFNGILVKHISFGWGKIVTIQKDSSDYILFVRFFKKEDSSYRFYLKSFYVYLKDVKSLPQNMKKLKVC